MCLTGASPSPVFTAEQYQQHQEQLVLMQKQQLEQSQQQQQQPLPLAAPPPPPQQLQHQTPPPPQKPSQQQQQQPTTNTQVSDTHGPASPSLNMSEPVMDQMLLHRRWCPRRWTRPVLSSLPRPSSPPTSCWPSSPRRSRSCPAGSTGSCQGQVGQSDLTFMAST